MADQLYKQRRIWVLEAESYAGFRSRVAVWFQKQNRIQVLEAEWNRDFRRRVGYGF